MINVDVQVTYGSWTPSQNIYDDLISLKNKAHTHENGTILDSINSGTFDNIAANTSARHTHENAETLNKLGESGGSLTYDGKAVGGRQTASVQINISDLLLDSPISAATNIYLNSTNQIPENSEIASVELNNGTIESPNWIDLRGMDALYPYNPYSVNFHKLNYSNALDAYFLASITFFSIDKNALISSLDNYGISQIRVTYYI